MGDMGRRQVNDQLSSLQVKGDVYMKQLLLEKKRVKDLDDALRHARAQIKDYREHTKLSAIEVLNLHRFTKNPAHQRADGLNPTKQAEQLQHKQLAILEVRLNKLKIRDAEADSYNERLKLQIDNLRKGRLVINSSHLKYEMWLKETRQRIFDLMEKASRSNDERERILQRRNDMIKENEMERKNFEEDYLKLGDYIDMQNTLFEDSISQAAKGMEKNLKAAMVDGSEESPINTNGPHHPLIGKLKELTNVNEMEKTSLESLQEKVKMYESSFEELKRVIGSDSIEELMTIFRKNEEEVFSLFNYIQTLNQEIEWTLESHATLQEEMKQFEEQQKEEDEQRAKNIRLNNQKLESTAKANTEGREGAQDALQVVDRIAKKVQSLFFKMQCDQMYGGENQKSSSSKNNSSNNTKSSKSAKSENRVIALSGNTVNDSNILEYMKVIEERLVQICAEYTKKMSQKDDTVPRIPHAGPSVPFNDKLEPQPLIRPPDTNGEEDGEEGGSDEKPVPLDFLRKRFKDKISYIQPGTSPMVGKGAPRATRLARKGSGGRLP